MPQVNVFFPQIISEDFSEDAVGLVNDIGDIQPLTGVLKSGYCFFVAGEAIRVMAWESILWRFRLSVFPPTFS